MLSTSKRSRHTWRSAAAAALGSALCACSLKAGKVPVPVTPPPPAPPAAVVIVAEPPAPSRPAPSDELEMVDLGHPQRLDELAKAAGESIALSDTCREKLHREFRQRFFAPWTSSKPLFSTREAKQLMKDEGRRLWYGQNKRTVPRQLMRELVENCALAGFPSRYVAAIAVAPGHLRGLPTELPLYEAAQDEPFDMLSFPQVKLNEPLRVLHASRDGVWLFVETGYANGWIEARDVAVVDQEFIRSRMKASQVVVVRDYTPVSDGNGTGIFPAKIGTLLPLERDAEGDWEVSIASAGDGGKAELHPVKVPREAAAAFPLEFDSENIAKIGNQFLGQAYGWGELYGLRDCSAMLRDFFLPFGIWLPRTSSDQIESVPRRIDLGGMEAKQKEETIRKKGVPFLTLLYKPGHIMLYVGVDRDGRPLVFHDAWSVRVKERGKEKTEIIGSSVITTLRPGKNRGLVPGTSLVERLTELGVITRHCGSNGK